ncbi:uncharacterized protein LOC144744615 [Ciona intestinalis]
MRMNIFSFLWLLLITLVSVESLIPSQSLTLFREFASELHDIVSDLKDVNCSNKCSEQCKWPTMMAGRSDCVKRGMRDTAALPEETKVKERVESLKQIWDCSKSHPCLGHGTTTDALVCMRGRLNGCHECVAVNCKHEHDLTIEDT